MYLVSLLYICIFSFETELCAERLNTPRERPERDKEDDMSKAGSSETSQEEEVYRNIEEIKTLYYGNR